jgi:predicted DNA-binding protein with PD1-like motif
MMDMIALRLRPGEDLRRALDSLARERAIDAACVVTCVGSLRRAVLRLAGGDRVVELEGPFEIVSLVGTLSQHGSHYHVALADRESRTVGGHLKDGCIVYTTAEVVIQIVPGVRFLREHDEETGFGELVVT